MTTISGLSHAMAFEYNEPLYVPGYRAVEEYLQSRADDGRTWLPFADESEEKLVAMPADEQRVAFVKMASQGRALVVGVSRYPAIEVYVSQDDGETWAANG